MSKIRLDFLCTSFCFNRCVRTFACTQCTQDAYHPLCRCLGFNLVFVPSLQLLCRLHSSPICEGGQNHIFHPFCKSQMAPLLPSLPCAYWQDNNNDIPTRNQVRSGETCQENLLYQMTQRTSPGLQSPCSKHTQLYDCQLTAVFNRNYTEVQRLPQHFLQSIHHSKQQQKPPAPGATSGISWQALLQHCHSNS